MGCHRKTSEEQTFAIPYSTSFSNMAKEIMLELITVICNEPNIELKM
jgi:hypothetical protein